VIRKVKFLRIDDRLIHGQVVVGWVPVLNVANIVVANERVAADPVRQEMMSLSIPPGIALYCYNPQNIPQDIDFGENTIVLVSSPKDALACLNSGLDPERVNVGGMHSKAGKIEIREAFHIDDEDRKFFSQILESGRVAEFQPTPQDDPIPLSEIL